MALVQFGLSKRPEAQVRWAQAKVPYPQSDSDWTITVVDSRALDDPGAPPPDGGAPDMATSHPDGGAGSDFQLYPEAIGIMTTTARKGDGSPAIAYYDRRRGNLRYVVFDSTKQAWAAPQILDGEGPGFVDTGDVGLFPSLTFDSADVGHLSYVDATHDNLIYVNTHDKTPEVVDDGYRPMDEMTLDHLAEPVFHLVGDSSSIQTAAGNILIAYQDSTVLQLRLARHPPDGKWSHELVAGHDDPFKGAYGFWANLRVAGGKGVISSYAINQMPDPPVFFVELFTVDLGIIM
jgi:hypothetical protein